MGMDSFAPWSINPNCFVVQNIAPDKKQIRIFNYPINWNDTRDLLRIPGVAEADIRASLLKGEINHKIRAREIIVICSDIDLLQFNDAQKVFLKEAGVIKGLEIGNDQLAPGTGTGGSVPVLFREQERLIGTTDGFNRTFVVPYSDKFIDGNYLGHDFHIQISHNGRILERDIDFKILESGGIGTGYDVILFLSFSPASRSRLLASYVIKI